MIASAGSAELVFTAMANVICLCDAPMCNGAVATSRVHLDVGGGGGFPEPRYEVGYVSPELGEVKQTVSGRVL